MRPRVGLTCSTADNGDGSFAVRCLTNYSYLNWLERAGALPLLLPNLSPELVPEMLAGLDGLLLTGGADVAPRLYGAEPEQHMGAVDVPRDRFELPLAREALAGSLPLLGICRGIQTLNVAAGGTLRQDLVSDAAAWVQHGMRLVAGPTWQHTIVLEPDSRLRQMVGADEVPVNSYHHQAVRDLAPGLRVAARAKDGTIEAIEAPGDRFVLAVQWHPEVMDTGEPVSEAIFSAFVSACRAGRDNR